ncbi:MAG TPA: hypothetical protein DEA32_03120, partial [Firmicutes bacterium]|nr:hypothetical protein [Bacillota bacterium]
QPKPRKDYVKYSDILPKIEFFEPVVYDRIEKLPFDEKIAKEDRVAILQAFLKDTGIERTPDTWFALIKEMGAKLGFAPSMKEYKQAPGQYKGFSGDVAAVIRVAVTGSKNSPSLYWVLKILGAEEIARRVESAIEKM